MGAKTKAGSSLEMLTALQVAEELPHSVAAERSQISFTEKQKAAVNLSTAPQEVVAKQGPCSPRLGSFKHCHVTFGTGRPNNTKI